MILLFPRDILLAVGKSQGIHGRNMEFPIPRVTPSWDTLFGRKSRPRELVCSIRRGAGGGGGGSSSFFFARDNIRSALLKG